MHHGFSQMSTPPSGPPPGYGGPPPSYAVPPAPQQNNTAKIVLIVLAVVFGGGIFLIAILAAILFPVFQKVRGNARLASCDSNVKQIELGLVQYIQDHDEKFPPKAAAYKDAVFPYIQSEQVFHCPSDKGGPVDYSMNTNLEGISLDKIFRPAEVVAIYEGKDQKPDFRHDGRAVIGYADGRVEELTEAEASNLHWKP